jgi:hypothetical protein
MTRTAMQRNTVSMTLTINLRQPGQAWWPLPKSVRRPTLADDRAIPKGAAVRLAGQLKLSE